MSTFRHPTYFYVFGMTNGREKFGYGTSPEDALEILRGRLTPEEMQLIDPAKYQRVSQRQTRDHLNKLG